MTPASFFIKKAWDTTGDDIFSMANDFYVSGLLPIGVNSSFITLGPQVAGANNNLKDFRPKSLIGCLYKIISKAVANELKAVMHEIIVDSQNTFIKGRQILDT
jgi:hypothetical protein